MELKKLLRAGGRYLTSPDYRFLVNAGLGFYDRMPDEAYLRRYFRAAMGKELDLEHPQTFNEKLQWLKLHDRKSEYTKMVDKIEAKKYVASILGEEYIIPTLGVWDSPDEIDFDALPEQFVLKCNHNSGLGMCICRDKSALDIPKVRRELRKGLRENYYLHGREWVYKDVKPRILAEQYLVDESGMELKDYKIMCFSGAAKCAFVCSDRFNSDGLRVTFFDRAWNIMPFERHYPRRTKPLRKPENYDKMLQFAEKLSSNIPFLRVDFYEIKGKLYFGELTFFPGSGIEEFTPEAWDSELGSWIKLLTI